MNLMKCFGAMLPFVLCCMVCSCVDCGELKGRIDKLDTDQEQISVQNEEILKLVQSGSKISAKSCESYCAYRLLDKHIKFNSSKGDLQIGKEQHEAYIICLEQCRDITSVIELAQ